MAHPRTLKIALETPGYSMEIDTQKADCNREPAHWHLCYHEDRIGSITPSGIWNEIKPSISTSVLEQAEKLTSAYEEAIYETYIYNKSNGFD